MAGTAAHGPGARRRRRGARRSGQLSGGQVPRRARRGRPADAMRRRDRGRPGARLGVDGGAGVASSPVAGRAAVGMRARRWPGALGPRRPPRGRTRPLVARAARSPAQRFAEGLLGPARSSSRRSLRSSGWRSAASAVRAPSPLSEALPRLGIAPGGDGAAPVPRGKPSRRSTLVMLGGRVLPKRRSSGRQRSARVQARAAVLGRVGPARGTPRRAPPPPA